MPEFVRDVEEIRQRAIRNIEEGAVTSAYQLDKDRTIAILNEALATEIVCVLRYLHHYFMATGVHGKGVADEFKEHADSEREHADKIAERIQQLGGKPDMNPGTLVQRSVSHYIEGETLGDMIREDLIAERMVIDVYSQMVRYFGDKDPTTRILIEHILSEEEEHASDLVDLLYIVEPSTGKDMGIDPGTNALNIDTGRRAERGQQRGQSEPAASQGRVSAQGGEFPAGQQHPGASGRPVRQRPQQTAETDVDESVDDSAQMGASRAVRVSRPNRKKRIA